MLSAPSASRGTSPLVVQCLVFASFAAPLAMYGAAWPDARSLFDQSSAALGTLATAYGIGRMATSASALAVLSRVHVRPATTALCLVLAAVDVLISSTRSFPVLLAAVGTVGLLSGVLDSLGNRYQTVVRDMRRAGLMFGAYGLGATLGPALISITSWRVGFLAAAVVALAAAAAAANPAVGWPDGLAEGSRRDRRARSAGPVRFDGRAVALSLALAGTFVGLEALTGNWMATYFEDHRGSSGRAAGLAVSGFWAGVTVGRLGLSRVRGSAARVLIWGSVAVVGAYALIPVLPTPAALPALAGAGVVLSVILPTVLSTTADRVGRVAAGRVSGWQLVAANSAAITLIALVGVSVSRWGGGIPMIALMVLAVLGVPLCWSAARRQETAPAEPRADPVAPPA